MTTTTSEPAVRGRHSPHERALRNGLGALALVNLVIGVWMVVAPASFVDNVGPFGEPNDHYVRDLATWYLSYAGVLTVAVGTRSWRVPVLVFGVAQGVLHIVNHIVDVGDADPVGVGIFNIVSLAALTGAMVWLLSMAREDEGQAAAR